MSRLARIDANLLVALDVLLEERHVTRAARRLGVTQSAMSQTLQRLREALGDPILVRSGRSMVATPRAEAMRGPLRASLRGLEATLAGAELFEPAAAVRTFRVATLDTYGQTLLPRLVALLADAGRGLGLEVVGHGNDTVWEALRAREIELAVVGPWDAPADIVVERLLGERMVAMVRVGHPILDGPIDMVAYARWPHAVTRISGRGTYPIDGRLRAVGLSRRVVARTPYFLAAPALVVDSDLIVTVPRSAAHTFAARWPVVLFDPPIGAPMVYDVSLAWPRYLDADAGHRWVREALFEIGRAVESEMTSGEGV